MSEDFLQIACANWIKAQMQHFDDIVGFHVPNGGLRNKKVGAKLKAMGVMAGVADLIILTNQPAIVFIELKTKKGRQQPTQKVFQDKVESLGFDYHIIKGDNPFQVVAELERILKQYRGDLR